MNILDWFFFSFFSFETKSCCVPQATFDLVEMLLSLPPESWGYRCSTTPTVKLITDEAESRKLCSVRKAGLECAMSTGEVWVSRQ